MKNKYSRLLSSLLVAAFFSLPLFSQAQVIISQYYEGTSTNKWLELSNLGTTPVDARAAHLRLGWWNKSGDTGNIAITGTPSATIALTITIPARGTVLIGNSINGNEVTYLTSRSAAQLADSVISFNGNDGIALLDGQNNIIDAFGNGLNAKDVSYVRNQSVTTPNATFNVAEWTKLTLSVVQNATELDDPNRLGAHLATNYPTCVVPTAQPTALTFGTPTTSSVSGSYTAASGTDNYLIVRSTSSQLTAAPARGTLYNTGQAFGGGIVVSSGPQTSFSSASLSSSTLYYFFIFSFNNTECNGGPEYIASNPLTGSVTTATPPVCSTPAAQPTNFTSTLVNSDFVQATFTAASADEYLVVISKSSTLSALPQDGNIYTAGNPLGGGTVVQRSASTIISATNLNPETLYYFYVFAVNSSCTGGPKYLTSAPLYASQSTIKAGSLNFYFGNLHSHSSYSDGNKENTSKTPVDDYAFAKNAMCMDFLGISEHNHNTAGMSLANYKPGINAAKAATTSTFVGLYGMEWGVISGGGHVVVYGVDSLIGWEPGNYQIYVPKSVYTGETGLFKAINRHGSYAFGYFAHPDSTNYNNLAQSPYDLNADNAVVGSAVESGPAFSTSTTYSNPGSSMSYLWYYNKLLAKGYHIGPTIDHDNHYLTFGQTAKSRLVILAASLSENDLLDGMKRMRFYASEDCAARVTYSINSQPLGSVIIEKNAPVISVSASTSSPVNSIKLYKGVPGSGILPTLITTSSSGAFTYTDNALTDLSTGYYYAYITENDSTRIVTSPIWYTRDDNNTLPVNLISFFCVNEPDRVTLKWMTAHELNNESFTIERMIDGEATFTPISSVAGKGNSTFNTSYAVADMHPSNGLAYYRLAQKDKDGKITYSDVRAVNRNKVASVGFTPYPNPTKDLLNVTVYDIKNETTTAQIFDLSGKLLLTKPVTVVQGSQNISFNLSAFASGSYILKIKLADKTISKLVQKM